jgi:hypothetical protein
MLINERYQKVGSLLEKVGSLLEEPMAPLGESFRCMLLPEDFAM